MNKLINFIEDIFELGFGLVLIFGFIPYSGYFIWNWSYDSTLPKLGSFLTLVIAVIATFLTVCFTSFCSLLVIAKNSEEIKEFRKKRSEANTQLVNEKLIQNSDDKKVS